MNQPEGESQGDLDTRPRHRVCHGRASRCQRQRSRFRSLEVPPCYRTPSARGTSAGRDINGQPPACIQVRHKPEDLFFEIQLPDPLDKALILDLVIAVRR